MSVCLYSPYCLPSMAPPTVCCGSSHFPEWLRPTCIVLVCFPCMSMAWYHCPSNSTSNLSSTPSLQFLSKACSPPECSWGSDRPAACPLPGPTAGPVAVATSPTGMQSLRVCGMGLHGWERKKNSILERSQRPLRRPPGGKEDNCAMTHCLGYNSPLGIFQNGISSQSLAPGVGGGGRGGTVYFLTRWPCS